MPNVAGKKYSYDKKGMAAAKKAKSKLMQRMRSKKVKKSKGTTTRG